MARFQLALLGRLALAGESAEIDVLLARRRLVALLAVLGASGSHGVPRDALLLYFWPESTATKARNSLNQALHALRRTLGRDAIDGTHDLRLSPAVVECDYPAFIAAAEAGDFNRVAELRGGPLLDGFSLANAPEWESWLAKERAREARVYCHALEQLARSAEHRGDRPTAVKWWCLLADMEPLSSRAATHAMRALTAAGDRSGAIALGERHVRYVRDEIEADPDVSVTDLMNQIRRVTPRSVPELPGTDADAEDSAEVPIFEAVAMNAGDRAVAGERVRRPRRTLFLIAGVAALLAVGAAAVTSYTRMGAQPSSAAAPLLIVEKITLSGAGSTDGAALAGLMAAAIDGVLGVRAVVATPGDPDRVRGTRTYRVTTDLVRQSGGRIRGSAVVLDERTAQPLAWATSMNDNGDVFALVDDLTRQVLLNVAARELGLHSSAVATSDLSALQAYLDGEGRLRDGQNAAAVEALSRATVLDTSFAYAFYRLGTAAELIGRDRLARASFDAASRNAAALPPFERTMIEAARALGNGRPFEAEQLYREAVVEYPRAVNALREVAWTTFYNSPLRGRPVSDAKPALRRLLELHPADPEALIYLARIATLEGDAREATALTRRLIATNVSTVENRAFRFLALADPAGVKRVTQALLATPSRLLDSIALRSVLNPDPATVEGLARALATPEPPRDAQGFGYRLLSQSLLARGRRTEAMLALDSAIAFDSAMALEVRALYNATPEFEFSPAEVAATRAMLQRWNPSDENETTVHSEAHRGLHGALRLYLLGRLAARAGDTRAVEASLNALGTVAVDPHMAQRVATLRSSLRAHLSFVRGDFRQALAHLDAANWPSSANVFIAEAGDRFLRAQLLERLRRPDEARAWYASLAQRTSYELVYFGLSEYRLAKLAGRDGRASARHFSRVRQVYASSDPPFAALAAEAASQR